MTESAKVALVTAAARGIGRGAAERFLAEGWHVALLDIDGDNLKKTMAAIGKPDTTLAITCDVSDPAQVDRAFEALTKRFGRLDALVNNAGIAIFGPIAQTSFADWQRVLAVNLNGPFLMTQRATLLLRDSGGGAIVNIASSRRSCR